MKVSLNWAQHQSNVDLKPNGLDDLVKKIGAQLGAVEEVIDYSQMYEGVLVASVVSCDKHPNADKLNVCLIDDGGTVQNVERNQDGYVQVVCGAPNVRAGIQVAWLPPGSTVPASYNDDPFVLGTRELRGIVSNGMLASASELGISDDHSGILEIDKPTEPGASFKALYGLDDVIIDIENKMFTHRPDCFGVLGVAREIAGIYGQQFKSPDWYVNPVSFNNENSDLPLTVKNEIIDEVPRFMAVSVKDVQIKPSPVWLQAGLSRVGIKSINNIVDITNYLAYVTGQPLHAYDYDKVASLSDNQATLVIRHPQPGETIALLNGKTIEPRAEAMMIAADKELIGVGGVMGGSSTEVDENTKNIILECANFDMYSIRRTSMAHGLFTDAVTRNNKGQSPLQNDRVLAKALELCVSQAGGTQASPVIDSVDCDKITIAHDGWIDQEISVTPDFINGRLGLDLSAEQITTLLQNVEFGHDKKEDGLSFYAPFWRTDIAIKEDIVEEVGRLYDFANVKLELPLVSTSPSKIDPVLELKQQIRSTLASLGANEVLTYGFVHGNLLQKTGQNSDLAFKLTNAISPDLQYYRMSLTPSLLTQVHQNIKAGHNSFSLFELNKTHSTLDMDEVTDLPRERTMLALVTADKTRTDAAYYSAKAQLDALAESMNISLSYQAIEDDLVYQLTAPFERSRSALVSIAETGALLGIIGEYKSSVSKELKLPTFCAGFELDLENLLDVSASATYVPLSRFPSISQDICFEVAQDLQYQTITNDLNECITAGRDLDQLATVAPIDIYQADNSDKKRITYRVQLTSYERTLTDAVLSKILDAAASGLHDTHGAVRI